MKKEIPKYGANDVLQFVGLNDLSIEEQTAINQISTKEFEKIKQKLNNSISMIVHIKTYSKNSSKPKFALHVRVIAPTDIIESCKSHDFDLLRALHKSFEDIARQIEHKFGVNATRQHTPHQKLGKRKRQTNLMKSGIM